MRLQIPAMAAYAYERVLRGKRASIGTPATVAVFKEYCTKVICGDARSMHTTHMRVASLLYALMTGGGQRDHSFSSGQARFDSQANSHLESIFCQQRE